MKIPSKIYQLRPRTLTYPSGLSILISGLSTLMLRQLQDPSKGFPGAICACGLRDGSRRHTQHWDTTCTVMTRAGRINKARKNGRRLWDPSSCPLAGLMVAKGKTQPHLPSETAAGKCLCRHREKHEVQPLRHWDANRIWEYLCLGGIAPAKGKENSNCGVQRAQSLIICFSIAWRAAERRGRETPSSPPSGSSLT